MKPTFVIAAGAKTTTEGVFAIGQKGGLPWNLPKEMNYFTATTTKNEKQLGKMNAVLMGRTTYESILKFAKNKEIPLPNRFCMVVSKTMPKNVNTCSSLEEAFEFLDKMENINCIFVAGGEQVYTEVFDKFEDRIQGVFFNEIQLPKLLGDKDFDCSFPKIPPSFKEKISWKIKDNDAVIEFAQYLKKQPEFSRKRKLPPKRVFQHEEDQYLEIINDLIENGVESGDRTGTGTRKSNGHRMEFSLTNSKGERVLPLLTTKHVPYKPVLTELLWFRDGNTNANALAEKKVFIWKDDASKETLTKRGFPERKEGDLGPIYGFQWRHWGAEYKDAFTKPEGGFDQLADIIEGLKKNPNGRRYIMSAWNVGDLKKMSLPPCHVLVQFSVENGNLITMMYQRSCDMGLGVPFNIASYSFLAHMVADCVGLKATKFVHFLGDTHIYNNHVDALKSQLTREPFEFPTLEIKTRERVEKAGGVLTIDSYIEEDFVVKNYESHASIPMEMSF